MTIAELREGDVVVLTCTRCAAQIEMRAQTVQTVTRPYRTLTGFGAIHACGRCWHVGAVVALKA